MSRIHAFGDDALGDLDAVGLVEALRAGEVSAAELVDAAIARTEAVNPALNGLAFEAFDRARARAQRAASVRRLLRRRAVVHQGQRRRRGHADDAGHRRVGSAANARRRRVRAGVPGDRTGAAGQDADVGVRLQRLGRAPAIGPVRNPWNPDYTAGASSSGAGAFVAAGVVPIAHANDGGGSIRIPAACNGLVGLKPTRGRLPLDKETAQMPLHLVANGVVSRSVRDTAAFLREAERVYRNPKLPPIGDVTQPGKQRLRIAVCTESDFARRQPGDPRADAEVGRPAGGTRPPGHRDRQSGARPLQGRLPLYWSFLAFAVVRGGRRMFGPSFDRTSWTT